jgi:hypothetical protein
MATTAPTKTPTPPPTPTPVLTKAPAKPPIAVPDLSSRVRLARRLLQMLLLGLLLVGLLASVLGYSAVQTTLDNYYQIVQEGSVSADAAQDARESLLAYHSAAADYLTLNDPAQRAQRRAEAQTEWASYQDAMRRSWQNRTDETFGELAVFDAADQASWDYNGQVNAMFSFVEAGDSARASQIFNQANTTLVRRVIPAINGLERVKLESMEDAYARTSAEIGNWVWVFGPVAGLAVLGLLGGFALTRFWLHYRWTWQLALASLVGLALLGWFLVSLLTAASQVEVMVRDAYDTISGVQSVKALATQADALESIALFAAANNQADVAQTTLRDYDQYIFLLEQQLCGERDCWQQVFVPTSSQTIDPAVIAAAEAGESKYGLPRTPLIANVHFQGEAQALETLRQHLSGYLAANEQLQVAIQANDLNQATILNRGVSAESLANLLEAANQERDIARAQFDQIWNRVRDQMELNLWLTLLFMAVAGLGAWGLLERRRSLFP